MNTKWDEEGYDQIIQQAKKAEEAYRAAYDRAYQQDVVNFVSAMKKYGISVSAIDEYRKKVTDGYRSVQNLVQNMKRHGVEYAVTLVQGNQNIKNQAMTVQTYGWIGAVGAISYESSAAWKFSQSGKRFSEDYNDLGAFMQTDEFKAAMQKAGVTQWKDKTLMLDTFFPWMNFESVDDYANARLESAMTGILSELPDVQPTLYEGTLEELGTALGVDGIDDWLDQVKLLMDSYGQASKPWRDFMDSDEIKKAMAQIKNPKARDMFEKALRGFLDDTPEGSLEAYNIGKGIGTFVDVVDLSDLCLDMALRYVSDYSVQVGYLDAMEEGLLQAGFGSGPVLELIDKMQDMYTDEFAYAMEKSSDYLLKEAKSGIVSAAIDGAAKYIPTIKQVDFGLGVVSGVAKVAWGDETSAYEGLAGLQQYDRCLTVAYENYERMMADGVATEQDVMQADKLYELLRATKVKEYEYMIELTDDKEKIREYAIKQDELSGKTGQFGGGGGGGRFTDTPGEPERLGVPFSNKKQSVSEKIQSAFELPQDPKPDPMDDLFQKANEGFSSIKNNKS